MWPWRSQSGGSRVWNEGGNYRVQFAGGQGAVPNPRDFHSDAHSCTVNSGGLSARTALESQPSFAQDSITGTRLPPSPVNISRGTVTESTKLHWPRPSDVSRCFPEQKAPRTLPTASAPCLKCRQRSLPCRMKADSPPPQTPIPCPAGAVAAWEKDGRPEPGGLRLTFSSSHTLKEAT